MELGIIGLGKIGGNLSLQCVEKGIKVVGKDVGPKPELTRKGVNVVKNYKEFVNSLRTPRIIYLSLPAGLAIDEVIGELVPYLDKGDVIIDGGNSYYRDSIRREVELSKQGIHLVDCGTSGGVEGARQGACFMVGGKKEAVRLCEPILKKLAVEGGYLHAGGPGTGHFVKLVHNGIEFGMLQAIGEGVELLKQSEFDINLKDTFRNWSNGSVIRGWLVDLMAKGLSEIKDLKDIPDHVEDTGEVNWLVQEAVEKEIPIPIITHSLIELLRSREKESNASRAIAVMRHEFGGHPYGRSDYIARERKKSRIHPVTP